MYMTITQILRYYENRDISSISHRHFNNMPKDVYPTYSVCIKGDNLYTFKMEELAKLAGITSTEYAKILKGQDAIKYDYQYTTGLYNRVSLNYENTSYFNVETVSPKISDIIIGAEFATQEPMHVKRYRNLAIETQSPEFPFYVGLQTPENLCFTRRDPIDDETNEIRAYDFISFEGYLVWTRGMYNSLEFQIIIHHPRHLMRSFDNPTFQYTFLDYYNYNRDKILEVMISHVSVIRKRSDSNTPCNPDIQNDDLYLQLETIKKVGCIPIYWKQMIPKEQQAFNVCRTTQEMKEAYELVRNYKELLFSYDPPCVEMSLIGSYKPSVNQRRNQFGVKIRYTERKYQEIENAKDFNFETFFSSVGGFVGIFLGYSLLQVPEFIDYVMNMRIRFKTIIR